MSVTTYEKHNSHPSSKVEYKSKPRKTKQHTDRIHYHAMGTKIEASGLDVKMAGPSKTKPPKRK